MNSGQRVLAFDKVRAPEQPTGPPASQVDTIRSSLEREASKYLGLSL